MRQFKIGSKMLPLEEIQVNLGSKTLSLLKVPDSKEVLDIVVAERGLSERHWPYWLEEWPATFALGAFLFRHWESPPQMTLDLGCGAGFLGLLWAEMGYSLFACDFNQDACRLTRQNLGNRNCEAKVFSADLFHFPSKSVFDLILVGELLYSRENISPVLDFLDRHLGAKGRAIACDAGRSSAETFEEAAVNQGFGVKRQAQPWPGMAKPADIYILTRPDHAQP